MFSLHIDTARTWRGGQNQVLLTVLGLRALGYRATLVAHSNGELRRRAAEGLDLIPIGPRGEMDLSAAWKLGRLVRSLNPDVIHAHDPHAVALGALALSLSGIDPRPVLIASRRVDLHIKKNSFSRWKYSRVDRFIAASNAISRMLISDGIDPARIVTVHEGIDTERLAATPPMNIHEEFWLPTGSPIVGSVGALVPHKGHRYLIESAPLVLKECPDARFVILGDGELRQTLESHIKEHHLGKHVVLAGFRFDALAFHKSFDMFVMPSITEGLGTSVIDAMAAGKPVIASNTGGIPEMVEHGVSGLLVSPRNHLELASAIIKLLKDEELRLSMGRAGQARAHERFTAERMVRETHAVYVATARTPHAVDTVYLSTAD